jgi:hypothetical protein
MLGPLPVRVTFLSLLPTVPYAEIKESLMVFRRQQDNQRENMSAWLLTCLSRNESNGPRGEQTDAGVTNGYRHGSNH